MSELFLGVDGGQSSTTALIATADGTIVGRGTAGPSNLIGTPDEGRRKFLEVIGAAVAEACGEAGLDPAAVRFRSACAGFSGGPDDKEELLRSIIAVDQIQVTTDALIALTGATAGGPGVIVIGGTGTIAFGRGANGRIARAGGWGYIFGDDGGAFDIARQALRVGLRIHEGWGSKSVLHDRLLEATGAPDMNVLLHRWYNTDEYPRERIAAFAPLVDQAAREGDAEAKGILDRMGRQLALIGMAVRNQLFQPGEEVQISPVGGVWQSEIILDTFIRILHIVDGNRVTPPRYAPAVGALIEAWQQAGFAPVTLSNVPETHK